jgi:hypothetical protein
MHAFVHTACERLLQVRDKLCSLTPNRDDMNRETREALDTERLQQMLNYNAFDAAAVSQTIRSALLTYTVCTRACTYNLYYSLRIYDLQQTYTVHYYCCKLYCYCYYHCYTQFSDYYIVYLYCICLL